MVDYNSTIPTFDQIEGNTLLQKMREMYDVLSENIKSEGAITKVTFENGIIEFSNEESTIASVDLSGVVINANLEGNSIIFTKIDNSKFSVSLEGLITDETAVLESRVDNLDDELNNVSSELATISSKTDNLETDNTSNKERISTLETDNTSNKQRISTLETDNTTNKGKISSLETDNTSNKQRISTLETDNTTNKGKISTLETNVNKAFINASFETQTSILTLTAVDGSSVKVTIPSGGGSGGGNVSDVIYDDTTKTITVNYVTGEPKTYTITQLTTLDSNLNSINTNIQEIESNVNSINTNIQEIENDINSNTEKISSLETFQTNYTSKIDDSFVNAEKVDDTTLRLTRNDGTTVDISFPKGLNVRFISGKSANAIVSNKNELVVVESCTLTGQDGSRESTVSIRDGLGYLRDIYMTPDTSDNVADGYNVIKLSPGATITVSGLLYDGAYVHNTI